MLFLPKNTGKVDSVKSVEEGQLKVFRAAQGHHPFTPFFTILNHLVNQKLFERSRTISSNY